MSAPNGPAGGAADASDQGGACIPNIGPRERRRRLVFGIVAWAVAVVALAFLLVYDVHRLWRLGLVVPLWAGGLGFFQHREKT